MYIYGGDSQYFRTGDFGRRAIIGVHPRDRIDRYILSIVAGPYDVSDNTSGLSEGPASGS